MTREEAERIALSSVMKYKKTILELPTGFGKTKLSLQCIQNHIDENNIKNPKILILVAKRVHIDTWKDEINKWQLLNKYNNKIICYNSMVHECGKIYDYIIMDECHHLSDMRKQYLHDIVVTHRLLGSSATLSKDIKEYFRFHGANIIQCRIKSAIEDEVLPQPKIIKVALELDNKTVCCKVKQFNRELTTTQRGAYKIMSKEIEWYKNKFMHTGNQRIKTIWLRKCKARLIWLSEQKEVILKHLLSSYKDRRTIIFCASIDQAERLCHNSITTRNKKAAETLDKFNKKKINQVSAVDILNEGVNLIDCQVGILGIMNATDIMYRQKIGRLLRHEHPIVLLPYYKDTREEEIVNDILETYKED